MITKPSETPLFPKAGQPQQRKETSMGDKSPKSRQKQAAQKKTKANDLQLQKQRELAAKQAGSLKKR
jgi:hypothetical protein